MVSSEPICQLCARDGERNVLQKSSYGDWACPFCGVVDDKVTSAANSVDVTDSRGAVVDGDETLAVKEGPWSDWREANLMKAVDRLLQIYMAHPESCILSKPCPSLIPAAKRIYIQIRDADKEIHGYEYKVVNTEAKKVRYHLAMAVKMAVQSSNVEHLARKREGRFGIMGGVHGDGNVPTPTITELSDRGRRLGPGHEGYFESIPFLILTHRTYAQKLGWQISLRESILCEVNIICNTLREIANRTHVERLATLQTNPDKRDWEETDWDHLRDIDWDLVMECANGLYQAQQCVSLWSPRCSPPIAIALTIASIQASNGRVMPQIHLIEKELGAVLGTSRYTTSERHVEIKKFLVGWSTSFPDAGIPIPILSRPKRGGYGNGLTHYESDAKKAVPEMEIAALSAQVLWKDWRKVMHARLKANAPVRPYDTQLTKARRMFVSVAPPIERRLKRNPDGTFQKHDRFGNLIGVPQGSSRDVTPSLESEIGESISSDSRFTSRSVSETPSSTSQSSIDYTARSTSNASPTLLATPTSFIHETSSHQAGPSRPREKQVRRVHNRYDLSKVNPDLDLEGLLANADHSSDEDYDQDSEDDTPRNRRKPDDATGLGLSNLKDRPGSVIGFSIGPNGFTTEIAPPTPLSQPNSAQEKYKRRSESVTSDMTGNGSGSEVERILKRPRSELSSTPAPVPRANLTAGRRVSKNKPPAAPSALSVQQTTPSAAIATTSDSNRSSRASSTASTSYTTATTPLQALSSLSPSPVPNSETAAPPRPPRGPREPESDSHVGVLYREREAYILIRASDLRKQGQIVSSEVEARMFKWMARQRLDGNLPRTFSSDYLSQLGVEGDVHEIDLSGFVESKKDVWSAVESLLRVGIKPSEIPPHYVVHSLLDVDLLLDHYTTRHKYLNPPTSREEEEEDDITFLFSNDGFDDYFLSQQESEERYKHILAEGTWDELPHGRIKVEGEGLWRKLEALGEGDEEMASDGIQEAIVNRISEKRGLRSSARTASARKGKKALDEDEEEEEEDDVGLDIGMELGEFGLFNEDSGKGKAKSGGREKKGKGKGKGRG